MRKSSDASSITRWALSDFWRISEIAERTPTLTSTGWPRSISISSIFTTSDGSAMTTARRPSSCSSGMKP